MLIYNSKYNEDVLVNSPIHPTASNSQVETIYMLYIWRVIVATAALQYQQ